MHNNFTDLLEREIISSYNHDKGLNYYYANRVKNVTYEIFNEDKFILFEAIVLGKEVYETSIVVQDFAIRSNCTCLDKVSKRYDYHCKHSIALMIKANEIINKEGITHIYQLPNPIQYLEKTYQKVNSKVLEPLNFFFELSYEYSDYKEPSFKIGAKAGVDKLYVIKNLKESIMTIKGYQERCMLTSKLDYSNNNFKISEVDQKILDFMYELIPYQEDRYYRPKYRFLAIPYNKLFELYELIKLKDQSHNFGKYQLILGNPNLKININEKDEKYLLSIDSKNVINILSHEYGIVSQENKIFKVKENYHNYIIPLLLLIEDRNNQFIVDKDDSDYFIKNILPYVIFNNPDTLNIDKKITDKIVISDLITNIYIDKVGKKVSLKIVFDYDNNDEAKNIIKNIPKENLIMDTIKELNVSKVNDLYFINSIEEIFKLSDEIIPILQSIDNVNLYHSEAFKRMLENRSFSYSAKIGFENDLLAIDFDYDHIDKGELVDILKNIKIKKKYYQLKNGDIIKIDNKDANDWSLIIDKLALDNKDIVNEKLLLNKYETLYLDDVFSEIDATKVVYEDEISYLLDNIKSTEHMDFDVPNNLKAKLRDYQVRGYKWLKTLKYYGFGGILADDMGLGKTIQVITLMLDSVNNNKFSKSLVIAPSSVIYNWEAEIRKFAPSLKYLVLADNKEIRSNMLEKLDDYNVIITSYALLRRDIDSYLNYEFEYCFLDEAQYIKNHFSVNSNVAKQINAKGKFALTGTPIENSVSELWSIFDYIMPGYLRSYHHFKNNYENPIIKEKDKEVLSKLYQKVSPFILRREKKTVALELPEKQETNVYITLNDNQRNIYMAYLLKAKKEIDVEITNNGFNRSQIKILSILTRLRQICCEPRLFIENYNKENSKLEYLMDLIDNKINNGHRILLFSQFTSMLDIIEKKLKKNSYFRIDGTVKTKDRMDMVNRFNMGEKSVFLISLKAGGTGLNLTGADTVIHYDPWWNPAVEDQATDRAYRIGQDKNVEVIKLIAKDTIEEKINELKDMKKEMAESIIKNGETFINKMSEDDIKHIFSINYDKI